MLKSLIKLAFLVVGLASASPTARAQVLTNTLYATSYISGTTIGASTIYRFSSPFLVTTLETWKGITGVTNSVYYTRQLFQSTLPQGVTEGNLYQFDTNYLVFNKSGSNYYVTVAAGKPIPLDPVDMSKNLTTFNDMGVYDPPSASDMGSTYWIQNGGWSQVRYIGENKINIYFGSYAGSVVDDAIYILTPDNKYHVFMWNNVGAVNGSTTYLPNSGYSAVRAFFAQSRYNQIITIVIDAKGADYLATGADVLYKYNSIYIDSQGNHLLSANTSSYVYKTENNTNSYSVLQPGDIVPAGSLWFHFISGGGAYYLNPTAAVTIFPPSTPVPTGSLQFLNNRTMVQPGEKAQLIWTVQ